MDFLKKHEEQTTGLLHGFDRLIFSGYLTSFFPEKGMYYYLSQTGIRLTGYKAFMERQTKSLKQHLEQISQQSKVNITYLNNSKASKDQLAKTALEKHATKTGLISIISCKETAYSFSLRKNGLKKELEVKKELRAHLHYYFYYMDREFGWMFVKIQSWYPFTIQVYINGREHLKRSLDKVGVGYESYNNSLTWVSDIDKAQQIADNLVQKKWDRFLNVFAQRLNPHLNQIQTAFQDNGYKWSMHQCEYATDVLFKERNVLEKLYTPLVQYATQFKGGEDIYFFFGRNLHGNCTKQVTGNTKRFIQGFRVKHYLDRNSIKMYDKHTILRIETTINNPRAFKIYKTVERKGRKVKAWVPMGKAVSNIYRYAQIAQSANTKYLNSLTSVDKQGNLAKQIEQISRKVSVQNRNNNQQNYSAFNLLSKEICLVLEAINDGRFCIQAFSNKQLRELLDEKGLFNQITNTPLPPKKMSGKVTRLIAKLRAHKLIFKINKSFKYKLTKLGQQICNSILKFKKLELQTL